MANILLISQKTHSTNDFLATRNAFKLLVTSLLAEIPYKAEGLLFKIVKMFEFLPTSNQFDL